MSAERGMVSFVLLFALFSGQPDAVQAQAVELDALSVFVVLKCLSGTFLSYGLNGVPLDPQSSGTFDLGPANGAGPASISPDVRGVLTSLLAEDATQLEQLRGLAGSRPACPRVNVGPVVWETFYSLAFATKDFNPYVDESKYIVALYFMKIIHQAVFEVDLNFVHDPTVLPTVQGIAQNAVDQASLLVALSNANANRTVLGSLSLAETENIFTDYLATVANLKVTPGVLERAPLNNLGQIASFSSVQDYVHLLSIPGSRRGGQFYPDGITLTPELLGGRPPVQAPAAAMGRRLLGLTSKAS